MKRTLLIFTALVFVSGIVTAQPGRGRGLSTGRFSRQGGFGMGRGYQILNLTDEQQEKIDELCLSHMKDMDALSIELAEKELELNKLRIANPSDSRAILGMIEEIGDLRTEAAKKKEIHFQNLRKELTEEQRAIFDTRGNGNGFGRVGRRGGRGMRTGGFGMRGGVGIRGGMGGRGAGIGLRGSRPGWR